MTRRDQHYIMVPMSGEATKYSGNAPFDFVLDAAQGLPYSRPRARGRIGELLITAGLITRKQLDEALAAQARQGGKLGKTLISLGYLDLQEFIRFVSREAGVGIIDLLNYEVKEECVELVPRHMAERHELMPVEKLGPMLTVAMVCPLNDAALDEVENHTGLKARPVMCTPDALWYSIKRHYPDERGVTPTPANEPQDDSNVLALERQLLAASVVGLVRRTESLGRLPRTLEYLKESLRDPNGTPRDLADILGRDPLLAAKILAIANGETFGFAGRVETLDLAVRLLGPREVLRVAESTEPWSVAGAEAVHLDYFRADALFTARAAERIMEAMGNDHIAAGFAAGLLCDIGRLALAIVAPNHYRNVGPDLKGVELIAAEQKYLGISHPEAGFMLAQRWGLPADVAETILFHHEPRRATRAKELAAAVCAAHRLADLSGSTIDEGRAAFRECLDLLQGAGLDFKAAVHVISELSYLREQLSV